MYNNLTPLVEKAARAYFARDADESILRYLSSANHRRLIDAVHDTYRRIPSTKDRDFLSAVYEDRIGGFPDRVSRAAAEHRIEIGAAWQLVRDFTRNVEARIISGKDA